MNPETNLYDITSKTINQGIGHSNRLRNIIDRMEERGELPVPIVGDPRYLLVKENYIALLKHRAEKSPKLEFKKEARRRLSEEFGISEYNVNENVLNSEKKRILARNNASTSKGKRRPNNAVNFSSYGLITVIISFLIILSWATTISYFGTELMVRIGVKMYAGVSTEMMSIKYQIQNYPASLRWLFHFLFFVVELIPLRLAIQKFDHQQYERLTGNWLAKEKLKFWDNLRVATMFAIFIGSGSMVVLFLTPGLDHLAAFFIGALMVSAGVGTSLVIRYTAESWK